MLKPFESTKGASWGGDPARGAAMGRGGGGPVDPDSPTITICNVPLDSGGYDSGGAYWGQSQTLFFIQDGQGGGDYFREGGASQAVRYAVEEYGVRESNVTFTPVHFEYYQLYGSCEDCGEYVSFPSESKDCGSCHCGGWIEGDAIDESQTETCESEFYDNYNN